MAQFFSKRADARLRLGLVVAAALLALLGGTAFAWVRGGHAWKIGEPLPQPIPFSHAIHAGELNLDCRFCHAGVERAADAGMPSAETCLGCHERVWNVTAQFAPLRTAIALGRPVEWSSVSRLPEHVRFDHAAHTGSGVACETCHGKVWEMPRTVRAETLSMGWCLDCHRDPAPRQRPVSRVFDREWNAAASAAHPVPASQVPATYTHFGVEVSPLMSCSTCHR